ncbi:MAG: LysM peptidoglycan-binding domain-containing protein [Methylobacter sp.]
MRFSRLNLGKQKHTLPVRYKNSVWERLLSLYSLPQIENERIERELNWYLRHPAYLARIQQRAEPYLHLILNEVEAKRIPGELALLPVVESAFIPDAYSKSDASGLWQFIPATGRLYGLKQNEWYDGRRDIYASTRAATAFLKHLGEHFNGDWYLALASYNFGKGNVGKAIAKNQELNRPTDYWSLDLPKETTDYVPRLLAIAKIFANVEKYNIDLKYIPNKPYCELVDAKSQLDLSKAAELAGTPLNEFLKLNPGFNRSSTAPEGPHHLLIPVANAQAFKQKLAQLPYDQRIDKQRHHYESAAQTRPEQSQAAYGLHKVKPGETLSGIAYKNNTTVNSLREANHLAGNTVKSGMLLKMPVAEKTANASKTVQPDTQRTQVYVVQKGDTFWNIAQRFSVTVNNLQDWNNMTAKSALLLGQKLMIKSANQQRASSVPARSIHYVVKQGDSLAQISRKFNVSIADLRKWNPPVTANNLVPGVKLIVILDT